MYALYTKSDRRFLGDISDEELQFLVDNLEEESLDDTDYDLSRLTLEYLRGNGLSPRLAQLLDGALGDQDDVEIVYEPK
jgi:processive 1,2-diacylglycerol beta-glucosyltransferase